VILTAQPQALRVAGLGSATESSSILDRETLSSMGATRQAARMAYWRAGIRDPHELERLVVEVHDAFNGLLPIGLQDLGLLAPDETVEALVGDLEQPPRDPLAHPVTGIAGRLPTNLSGGLKARGHPVGGTGLFQIAEVALQLCERFPNPAAQVTGAEIGLAHSIGGPGNNNYVTLIERTDSRRTRKPAPPPRMRFGGSARDRTPIADVQREGARAVLEAATTIHVTAGDAAAPVHVALARIGDQRVFVRLDAPAGEGDTADEALAGRRVRLLVKEDGDHYVQIEPGGSGLSGLLEAVRRRVGFAPLRVRREEPGEQESA
jgi:hypothetical protein